MEAFAALLDRLYFTHGNLAKAALIRAYLARTPDPDRGWAVAAIAGELSFDLFKRGLVQAVMAERCDPTLLAMSRDYVGELSETVAHLWPTEVDVATRGPLPPLHAVIAGFRADSKLDVRARLVALLDAMTPAERWALLKLGTSALRVGVSARFIKRVLAEFGGVDVAEVEEVWHGLSPPYESLFAWLEGRAPKPNVADSVTFHPVMLAHPLDDADAHRITPEAYQAEWKYDGIRVQVVSLPAGRAIFSRTGDDISAAFPDVLERIDFEAVLDGELVIRTADAIGSFNDLQQRLGRKLPPAKLLAASPGHLILYDALRLGGQDIRALPLSQRRSRLAAWIAGHRPRGVDLSEALPFETADDLAALRATSEAHGAHIEGLMLKRHDSPYVAGRPVGLWYKWKRGPLLVDAVLMYAQRGSGKRSSFYSDFTFGLWRGNELLPVGKAYFGFTDEELKLLDKWVRNHTTARFGPVREVAKELVFEVAFDAVATSTRHKSGVAMRFPRINRIRWDKPAGEADTMAVLDKWLKPAILSDPLPARG